VKVPEKVKVMYRLWEEGYTFADLADTFGKGTSTISYLLNRYYPDIDFKKQGAERSQEARGCLTKEEKSRLVRECGCNCGGVIPQFKMRDGKFVRNRRLYIEGHYRQ